MILAKLQAYLLQQQQQQNESTVSSNRNDGEGDYDNEEAEIEAHLKRLEEVSSASKVKSNNNSSKGKVIPSFFRPVSELRARFKAEARKEVLQKKNEKMWDSNIMQLLWRLLLEHCYTEPGKEGDASESGIIDYSSFATVRAELIQTWNEKERFQYEGNPIGSEPFLTSLSFARLPKDDFGRVSIKTFFTYILKKVTLYQARIELGTNDISGDGCLTEPELENYFYDLLPTLPALTRLPENFYPFYICGAVRKFFFFLDPQRRGRISIDTIMQSTVLHELLDLHDASEDEECPGNWFAASTAAKVYGHYVHLDTDRNGMLNKSELYNYNDGSFTRLFIDRVFEVTQTYNGEMDYKKYIDFVLAMENPSSKPAFDFFWRILDLREDGRLTPLIVRTFYRDVQTKLGENGIDPVAMEDVVLEIFDMVNPKVTLTIYKADLERCRNRDTIISLLVDFRAFYRYDNREYFNSQQAPLPPSPPPAGTANTTTSPTSSPPSPPSLPPP